MPLLDCSSNITFCNKDPIKYFYLYLFIFIFISVKNSYCLFNLEMDQFLNWQIIFFSAQLNTTVSEAIKTSPYEVLFGVKPISPHEPGLGVRNVELEEEEDKGMFSMFTFMLGLWK